MPESKTDARLRFKAEVFDVIAADRGLTTGDERARFLNVNPSNYSRIARGRARPSEQFVADVMTAFRDDPAVSFETLFEVEVASA